MTCFTIENANNSLIIKTYKCKKPRKIRKNIKKLLIKTCNQNKENSKNIGKTRRKRTSELQDSKVKLYIEKCQAETSLTH